MLAAFALLAALSSPAHSSPSQAEGRAPAGFAFDPEHTPLEASATQASDGRFTLRLLPGLAWSEAELSVNGAGSQDLGPTDGLAAVEIDGIRDAMGPMSVDLQVMALDGRGVSWRFEVQPELIPVGELPKVAPTGEKKKRRRSRPEPRP